jgi:hypothetical protein
MEIKAKRAFPHVCDIRCRGLAPPLSAAIFPAPSPPQCATGSKPPLKLSSVIPWVRHILHFLPPLVQPFPVYRILSRKSGFCIGEALFNSSQTPGSKLPSTTSCASIPPPSHNRTLLMQGSNHPHSASMSEVNGEIKQIACGRRKPNMTRKEYNDHRFRVHGALSDAEEASPQYTVHLVFLGFSQTITH